MNGGYIYFDISLKLSKTTESVLPIFLKGSIEHSLKNIFGEIGGEATVDILKFDRATNRGIVRVPENYYVKTRAAIALIGRFQNIRCHIKVHAVSPVLLSLLSSHLEFNS